MNVRGKAAFVAASMVLSIVGVAQAQIVVQPPRVGVAVQVPQMVVRMPPPPVRVEVAPAAPGAGYVWTGGSWQYANNQHHWVAGSWQQPPQRDQQWVSAHWGEHNGQWTYRPGRWHGEGAIEANVAPPAPIVEEAPAVPTAGHRWLGGHWMWNGNQHFWVGGHWEQPTAGATVYAPGRWEGRGRGHAWVPGGWR